MIYSHSIGLEFVLRDIGIVFDWSRVVQLVDIEVNSLDEICFGARGDFSIDIYCSSGAQVALK